MGYWKPMVSDGTSYKSNPINPNPGLFIINEAINVEEFCIAKVTYPNCTNFEGEKILLFKNMTVEELTSQLEIDPHFSGDSKLIARFIPTLEGWNMALQLCMASAKTY